MPPIKTGAALLIAAVVPLTACGSSNPTTSGGATTKFNAALSLARCMRAHGVPNFPDPSGNGRGGLQIQQSQRAGSGASMKVNGVAVNAPAFQGAMQSCRSKLPNGGQPPPLSASRRAAMLKFSQCMRAHGLPNFPDPTFGAGGGVRIGFGPSSGINPSSPVFQAAQKACAPTGRGLEFKTAGPPPGG
jgi:hypothetical protein